MPKSPDAFRTISEVADWLGIQAHVLRFWESKFTQVKPIKRAGGRRYYRPADMLLLGGIKKLLHDDGLTIKGVQKILREEGMSHVAGMSMPLDDLTMSQLGDVEKPARSKPATAVETPEEEKGVVLSFEGSAAPTAADTTPQSIDTKKQTAPEIEDAAQPDAGEPASDTPASAASEESADSKLPETTAEPAREPIPPQTGEAQEHASVPEEPEEAQSDEPAAKDAEEPAPVEALPAFLRRPLADQDVRAEKPEVPAKPTAEETTPVPTPEPVAAEPKKPRVIDLPAFTAEADFAATPAALTSALRARKIAPENADKAATLLRQLTALRDSMSARRRNATPPPSQD